MNKRLIDAKYDAQGGTKDARCANCKGYANRWIRVLLGSLAQRWCKTNRASVDDYGVCRRHALKDGKL